MFLYLTLRIGFEQLFLFHLLQQTFEAPMFFLALCVDAMLESLSPQLISLVRPSGNLAGPPAAIHG